MNSTIEKTSIINKVQNSLKENYRLILIIVVLIIAGMASFQFYLINEKNKIFKSSIIFNIAKINKDSLSFEKQILDLSKENNFYGILATLENIKIKLEKNNIDAAYLDYLSLIESKKLNKLYKSAIALNGSYSLLNKINLVDIHSLENKNKIIDIISKINNLVSYIDDSIDSYVGYKIEISYLIAVINNDQNLNFDEINFLYKQIQVNDKISSSIKERIKKIHEFQKYK